MRDAPKTLAEARKRTYGAWAGRPKGTPYREGYCVEEVHEPGRGIRFYQCQRRAVVGLFCKQHHPDAVKEREAKSLAKYKADMARRMAPLVDRERFRKALRKIAEVRPTTVAELKAIARKALAGESS